MMTIQEFAEKYRVKRLPAGKPSKMNNNRPIEAYEDVVEGRFGHIVEPSGKPFIVKPPSSWASAAGNSVLSLLLLAVPRSANMDRALGSRFKMAEKAGFALKVKSGAESEWYFDGSNAKHAQEAIRIVGARRKRLHVLTEEQKQVLRERLRKARAA